jgi:superfamily II DNA or RNA helicase
MSCAFDLVPSTQPVPDYYEVPGARPYQKEMLRDAIESFAADDLLNAQLIVSATGTGKTVMMGGLAKTFVRSDQRVLMLAHRDELLTQGIDKFRRLGGVESGLEKAENRASLSDQVVVASVQTMRGMRLQSWPRDHFGLVMVDEAHRTLAKGYLDVLNHFDTARRIGVTATADRGDKQLLGQCYQRIVQPEYNMRAAIEDGWLVRVEIQPISVKIDLNGVGVKKNTDGDSDLDAKVVSHRIEPYLEDIAKEIWEHARQRRILGFAPSVDIAQKMVDICRKVGFSSVDWVAGEDRARAQKIAAYKRGEIQMLWNAMLLTEGFDQDDIDALVPLRPTVVRGLYTQMVGRGTRPLQEIVSHLNAAEDAAARRAIIAASRKPHVLVLDPLWLHEKHDLAAAASLVSQNPDEVKLAKGKQGDLLTIAAEASRDLWDSLREQLLKNANRRVARIDPFTFGVILGQEEIANYHPDTLWNARPPTIEQLKILIDNGIEAEKVKFRGQADKMRKVIEQRQERGLCSIRLMNWLSRHKIEAALMTHEEATKHQRRLFASGFRA